ncbi:MAG: TonB-dependent receptor [bacterium]
MKLKNSIMILGLCVLLTAKSLIAQNGDAVLSGFVSDASNGEALIGANVYLNELKIGTATNTSGYYVIPNINPGKYEIVVSFLGYKSFSEIISLVNSENRRLNIKLEPEAIMGQEVIVSADSIKTIDKLFNKSISKIDLNLSQIGKVPQVIEADLLRTLQTLPGIVPLSDFSSAIYVRGGTPDQNLFLIDGTDVYNPEHAFGLFSTFNTDAIKKVEIYKGGFGAEYGGRLSSVINVTNNDGNRNEFEGKVSLSLLALNTTLQTPLGSFGSLSGSFRRTYLDQTVAKFVDDIPDYYFYDGNLKAFFDIDESNKLSVSYYGGEDNLDIVFDEDKPDSPGFTYVWGNQTGSINWKTLFGPKLFGNFWITSSYFFSDFNFEGVEFIEQNRINDITFKGALEYFFSDHFIFKFGFEQKNVSGGLKQEFVSGKVDVTKERKLYSAYFTTTWKPDPLWDIEAGIRSDYLDSDKDYSNIDPRLNIKYRLSTRSNLKFSSGIFHQYANRIPRLFFVSIWTTADENVEGSDASHFILGYQRELFNKIELEVEAYYKNYHNIYSYNSTFFVDVEPSGYTDDDKPIFNSSKGLFNKGDGYSYGLEFLLRKDVGAITGWLAYSLAQTKYTIVNVNRGTAFPPRHDRTHVVNFVSSIDLNNIFNELRGEQFTDSDKKWTLGITFTYFSGQPITLPASVYVANTAPDWDLNENSLSIYPSGINEYRLPYYSRLDLSLTYDIQYDGWSLSPYIQVFNALNRKNVWFIEYENKIEDGIVKQQVNNVNMFPILPSIGVNVRF